MSKDTKIQWCDHTWNPWRGCRKVSPECENCYIVHTAPFRTTGQTHGDKRVRAGDSYLKEPLEWNAAAEKADVRRRVFCMSLGDWLDTENVPLQWWVGILDMIRQTPWLDWLLLTKRPQNFNKRMRELAVLESAFEHASETAAWAMQWEQGKKIPHNVWIGVSAGVDCTAALDIPAPVHFLSCEPMIKPLDETHARWFDWIIFGGESGPGAREMEILWLENGLSFCREHRIPAFVKQLGEKPHSNYALRQDRLNEMKSEKRGDWSEWTRPFAHLKVREFPNPQVPVEYTPVPF